MDGGVFGRLLPFSRVPSGVAVPVAGLAEVRAYWEALRIGGEIPARAAIDPRGISTSLERVFLAEKMGPGLAQIRLSGNRVNELAGLDARGLPLSCLFNPESRGELGRLLRRVFDGPVAADMQLDARSQSLRPPLAARCILLPLADAKGICTLVLGCISLEGEIGGAPRRFDIVRAVEERLLCEPKSCTVGLETTQPVPHQRHLRLVYAAD